MTNQTEFTPQGRALLIGSLPVDDYDQALRMIMAHTPEIPLWPQLPSNPLERMLNQFIEGLPGLVETESSTWFDLGTPDFEAEQLTFYEEYLRVSEDHSQLLNSRFAISGKRARGIYALRESLRHASPSAVKGQITGPFTLLTGLHDKDHKLGYYNPEFRDIAVKNLAMKAAWQVEFLRDSQPVIIFIDEPALAGLGSSAFISIAQEDIAQDLGEVISAIQQSGGLAGIHVCANTDWPFLLSVGLDILSFDAYGYFDRLIACKSDVHAFLDKGGIIAWGIIPTANEKLIAAETAASLARRWESQVEQLCGGNWNRSAILERSLITPSCGTGALPLAAAETVLRLTEETVKIITNVTV